MPDHYKKYLKYKKKYFANKMITGGVRQDKEIYFIRHGETEWNKLKKTQGQESDIELNDAGRLQSEKTGIYLLNYRLITDNFDCIISSPLIRASETAQIIASQLKFRNEILFFDNLKEVKKGIFSGMTSTESNKYNTALSEVNDYVNNMKDPIERTLANELYFGKLLEDKVGETGIESNDELFARCDSIIEYLLNIPHKKIIVVSHSGLLHVLFQRMFHIYEVPYGNLDNGKNCWISFVKLTNGIFTMVTPPNTKHFES